MNNLLVVSNLICRIVMIFIPTKLVIILNKMVIINNLVYRQNNETVHNDVQNAALKWFWTLFHFLFNINNNQHLFYVVSCRHWNRKTKKKFHLMFTFYAFQIRRNHFVLHTLFNILKCTIFSQRKYWTKLFCTLGNFQEIAFPLWDSVRR